MCQNLSRLVIPDADVALPTLRQHQWDVMDGLKSRIVYGASQDSDLRIASDAG